MYNVKIMDNQNSLAVLREDKKLQKQGILWRAEDNGVRSCNITKGILNLLSYDKTITNIISRSNLSHNIQMECKTRNIP